MGFDLREIDAKAGATIRLRAQVGVEEAKFGGSLQATSTQANPLPINSNSTDSSFVRIRRLPVRISDMVHSPVVATYCGNLLRLNTRLALTQELPG
ncbi:MAG: hypothetical protein IPG64_09010 [Haliea sp.]|nr:hypothetical protein [Haliea sp.]